MEEYVNCVIIHLSKRPTGNLFRSLFKVNLFFFKLSLYLYSPFCKIACQKCDGKKAYDVKRYSGKYIFSFVTNAATEDRFKIRPQYLVACREYLIKIKVNQKSVCYAACRRSIKPAFAIEKNAGAYY